MSYLDLLPSDISQYIYTISAANTIIDYWYKYIQKKIRIIYKIIDIIDFNPWTHNHSTLFYKASKIISGNDDHEWWSAIIIKFAMSINYCPLSTKRMVNYQLLTQDDLNCYSLSICSCLVLAEKFNIKTLVDNIIFIQ